MNQVFKHLNDRQKNPDFYTSSSKSTRSIPKDLKIYQLIDTTHCHPYKYE